MGQVGFLKGDDFEMETIQTKNKGVYGKCEPKPKSHTQF